MATTPHRSLGAVTPPAALAGGQWSPDGYLYQAPNGQWYAPPGHPRNRSGSWKPSDAPVSQAQTLARGLPILAAPFVLPALAGGGGGAAAATTAAPAATGGATAAGGGMSLSSALPYIQGAGAVGGAIANNRAANRQAEAVYNQSQDAAADRRADTGLQQINSDLDQRRYADDNYQQNVRNAMFGDFARGVQDVSISSPSNIPRSTISGGLRPSAMQGRGELGELMRTRAMANLMNPIEPGGIAQSDGSVQGGPGSRRLPTLSALPELREVPETSGVDSAMGWLDAAGAGLGFLEDERQRRRSGQRVLPALPQSPVFTPSMGRPGSVTFAT
jgi:hypothetical protein